MKEKLVGVTFMTYFPPRVGYFSIYPIIHLICTFKKCIFQSSILNNLLSDTKIKEKPIMDKHNGNYKIKLLTDLCFSIKSQARTPTEKTCS